MYILFIFLLLLELLLLYISLTMDKLQSYITSMLLKENAEWISTVFETFSRMDTVIEYPQVSDTYEYKFYDVVLKTKLTTSSLPPGKGLICGENGGLTLKNLPCKRKASSEGRCCNHIVSKITFLPGRTFTSVTIHIPKESSRPTPSYFPWDTVVATILDCDMSIKTFMIDLHGTSFSHTCTAWIWDTIILQLKTYCNIQGQILFNNETLIADPYLPIKTFREQYQISEKIFAAHNNRELLDGYLLKDYEDDTTQDDTTPLSLYS